MSSAMTRRESAKANCAIAKATPCFSWFSWSLAGSHSNRAFAIAQVSMDMAFKPYAGMAVRAAA
jgi:hypothetical protein